MGHPKTTPRKRGSQDDWTTTPLAEYVFESPVKPRKASTRRPPFSPTSPNTGRTPPRARTARQSTKRLQLVDNDGDGGVWGLSEEESGYEKLNVGTRRTASFTATLLVEASCVHWEEEEEACLVEGEEGAERTSPQLPPVDREYAEMTAERLFNEGHIATGSFSYNHLQFVAEAAVFNSVKVNGKPVWQKQPSGPSTLHNSIIITDHFPSLAPFLGPLEKLCTPRASTNRLFLAQRAQQYTKSGRRHRDGNNGPWWICVTVHKPEAPADFKQMEVGVADAGKAKGGGAVNEWQLKADGEPDSVQFECPSASYHIMDKIGTGTISHTHHQAIIRVFSLVDARTIIPCGLQA
eukprot:g16247.t1